MGGGAVRTASWPAALSTVFCFTASSKSGSLSPVRSSRVVLTVCFGVVCAIHVGRDLIQSFPVCSHLVCSVTDHHHLSV